MANKEYQMMFKLGAQLGSEFGKTFSSAEKTINGLQTEIQALSHAQSDISAYEKQKSAVEKTADKLELYKQELANIQKEIAGTEGYSSKLANSQAVMESKIKNTAEKLQNETAKLDEMGRALNEAGIDTKDLTKESQKLDAEMDRLADQMQNETAPSLSAVGDALIAAGIAQGVKEIAAAYKECITVSANFEQSMAQVAATMGTTSDEITDLSAFAKEMGAATSFSAVESAEGLNILAMAGLNAEQQIAALPTVLDLAAAGGMDMATSAGYVTGAVKGFADSMDNSAYYADLMAKGATMANTNVSQLGEALSQTAATASSYKQKADSVTVALLRLAEQNVVGSTAATQLNRAMADLYTPTEEAAGALTELGIAAYDANGNARDFNTVVDELNVVLETYSDEQKNAYKNTIFTQNGLQAFNKMTVSTTETVNKFADGLANATGSTAKQAETQLDNLNGAMTILQSATEGLQITLGEAYQPTLTKIIKLGTQVISVINDFLAEHPYLTKAIIAGGAALGGTVVAITGYIAATKLAAAATAALGTTIHVALPEIAAIAAGIALVTGAATYLIAKTNEIGKEERELTATSREEYWQLQETTAQYEEASRTYGENSEEAQSLRWQVEYLTESYEANRQTMEEYAAAHKELIDSINEESEAGIAAMDSLASESSYTLSLVGRLQELAEQSEETAGAQGEMEAIIAKLNEEIPDLALNLDDVLNGKTDFSVVEAMAKAKAESELYAEAQDSLVEAYKNRQAAEDELVDNQAKLELAEQQYAEAVAKYEEMYSTDTTGLTMFFTAEGKAVRALEDEIETLSSEVEESESAVSGANAEYEKASGIIQEYSGVVAGATESEQAAIDTIISTVSELNALTVAYNEAYQAALESFNGQFGLFDEAKADMESTVSAAQSALDSQLEYWTSYRDNVNVLKETSASDLGVTEENYNAIMAFVQDGSEEAAGLAASMVEAIQSGDEEAVAHLATTLSEVQSAQDEAAQTVAEWQTDFNGKMDEVLEKATQTVQDLDLTSPATVAAVNTMNAYANEIYSTGQQAVANAQSIARQVQAALAQANAATVTGGRGYASGTENATPGIHEVAENGPEIVMSRQYAQFSGGETVINAEKTAEILRGGGTSVNVSPVININGSADSSVATDISSAIVEQVMNALEEAGIDNRRRVYR